MEAVERLSQQLPPGVIDGDHSLSSELEAELLKDILDEQAQRLIEDRTYTRIETLDSGTDEDGTSYIRITITGPLLSTYLAHYLLMQRVHEHSAAEHGGQGGEGGKVAELQAQVAALQNQLRSAGSAEGGRRGPPRGRKRGGRAATGRR
jgi:hypothetical protein